MNGKVIALAALLVVVYAPAAVALGKGTSMLAIGLGNGTADIAGPGDGTYAQAFDHSENSVQAQYWNMLTDDYAFTIAAGYGFFSETDAPGDSLAGAPDLKYSQTSFQVRIGGDRVVKIGERALIFFGPGIEYWNGKAKFENFGLVAPPAVDELETESTSRISLSGRIGGVMLVGPSWGLTGNVGHKIGYATVTELGSKTTWWPSSMDAGGGIVFMFGEK